MEDGRESCPGEVDGDRPLLMCCLGLCLEGKTQCDPVEKKGTQRLFYSVDEFVLRGANK